MITYLLNGTTWKDIAAEIVSLFLFIGLDRQVKKLTKYKLYSNYN